MVKTIRNWIVGQSKLRDWQEQMEKPSPIKKNPPPEKVDEKLAEKIPLIYQTAWIYGKERN